MKESSIIGAFRKIGIQLSDHQAMQFRLYYELLIEWNDKINLTAITDEEEVLLKHFVDSVLSIKVVDYGMYESLIDIGTGAGFPGIPLKIVFPHLEVVLVDALNKRVQFLEKVIEALGLERIESVHSRAEDLARTGYRENYDLCVSRAVSQLNVLCEYCLPFIKTGGLFVSYKGAKTMEELESSMNAIKVLGGTLENVQDDVNLNALINRGFVCVRKSATTEDKYPRRSGKALKKPL